MENFSFERAFADPAPYAQTKQAGPGPLVRNNQLLAALPHEDWQRWRPLLEVVALPVGLVLHEPGSALTHVYFPVDAVISVVCVTKDGACAEVAVVGKEGLVGTSVFMGDGSTPTQAVVHSAGMGVRMRADSIRAEFSKSAAVMRLLLRYTQALIAQTAQTAVCYRHHTLDEQLCRRLLLGIDRIEGNELLMTQDRMARMLGVRREGVTGAALKLQAAGLIRYTRGQISVIDRPGLERRTCECYAVVKKEYERLLPLPAGAAAAAH